MKRMLIGKKRDEKSIVEKNTQLYVMVEMRKIMEKMRVMRTWKKKMANGKIRSRWDEEREELREGR